MSRFYRGRYVSKILVANVLLCVLIRAAETCVRAAGRHGLEQGHPRTRHLPDRVLHPSLLGGSVAIAIVWRQIFDGSGLVNQFLGWFGITGPSWIAHPDYVVYTIITLSVWQFGSAMVIFLAGLKQIPADLYEASGVDGAGKIRQFFGITLPMLSPVIFFNLIMSMINSFQAFTPAYVIGDGRGGPLDATMFYTLYLYLKGFSFFDMGYASALAWIMLVIIGVFTGIVFLTSKFWVFYGDNQEGR